MAYNGDDWQKEGENWKDDEEKPKQRMSYEVARNEMERAGWERPSGCMIRCFSILGKRQFMQLMESSVTYADIEADHLAYITGQKIERGSVTYTQLQILRRSAMCKMFLDGVREVRKAGNKGDIMYVPATDSEMREQIRKSYEKQDPKIHLKKLEDAFREREGGKLEF